MQLFFKKLHLLMLNVNKYNACITHMLQLINIYNKNKNCV